MGCWPRVGGGVLFRAIKGRKGGRKMKVRGKKVKQSRRPRLTWWEAGKHLIGKLMKSVNTVCLCLCAFCVSLSLDMSLIRSHTPTISQAIRSPPPFPAASS